ncbi:competence type IV pilus minor pilin ComGG [Alkalihalobacterium chitinilyticum]|uniref:Competence type IV pilus minor pilin ComGG n=1 Tax=Alkalihalobacterium chitinilyticum TaxID=2980103 RepID=A0ABT5V9Z8_9BACI|nr:competence type IV pilus minor pilin ComGG [Alkalihalobacterium chitinilyticum]MDE5412284.1 competence type IV pilus minor pilin ComGG [Alkalihalobacterium chitinilyticum]
MKKNGQKGFILPITLIFCLLLSLALMHVLDMYLTEKKFYAEQEEIFLLESLLQMATVDLVDDLTTNRLSSTGAFNYEKGTAVYWILEDTHDTVNIQLKVRTDKERQRVVRFLLDKDKMRVKEWIEYTMG